ncbi:ATP-binding cassette domain-containing protein [Gordonia sp. (in: high G+C Gram-positive bacteria)]|uniref:ATP-binding cassette domain-containing protein n=1 Tax=Gordonia sp. (in: high G+C Gram-positive bacteria) TaxID=84139 RepID=UPI003F9BDEA7
MIVRPLWREAAQFPARLAGAVALLTAISATHVAQAVAVACAMAAVVDGRSGEVAVALAAIVAILAIRVAAMLAQASTAARLGGQVRGEIRRRALTAVLSPSSLHDETVRDGTLRATVTDGVDGTDSYVAKYIPALAQLAIVCPAVVVSLLFLSPIAAVAVALGVVVALAGPKVWRRLSARRSREHWDTYESLSADLLESLRGMPTLRVLGDVPGTRATVGRRSEELRAATERSMRVSLAETGVTDFAVQAGMFAAAATAIGAATTGRTPTIGVYLILLLASEAFRPVRDLSKHWHSGFLGVSAIVGLTRIGAFDDAPRGEPVATPSHRSAHELRVSGVSFTYPGASAPVLDELTLTATRGAISAVVGASGAGKSTLLDVLLGFLRPGAGSIELDGRPLRPGDVAVLSQHPVLFAGTVAENLAAARTASRAEMVDACRAAGILADVQSLADGFDTAVDENGGNLSGGQRQRLALARALLAQRPVLLVDEPTSALDAARAADVLDTLHRVATDRIVVMVSHRPESLVDVPDVYRLDAGALTREVR